MRDSILVLLVSRLANPGRGSLSWRHCFVIPAAVLVRERFVLGDGDPARVFVAAYFTTPYDVTWHVWASWSRLTSQLAAPIFCVVMVAVVAMLNEPRGTQSRESPA